MVLLAVLAADAVEGRLGEIDVVLADEFGHVAEEEGEEQRADVGAVDIGIGHDDDLAVAALGDVELFGANACADGEDEGLDFLVVEHLGDAGLLDVEELAPQGQDGLEDGVAALLGVAAGLCPRR